MGNDTTGEMIEILDPATSRRQREALRIASSKLSEETGANVYI